MNNITVEQLKQKLDQNDDLVLIDVRELYEHEAFNIGGKLMPLSELFEHINEIPRNKEVVIYCKKGIRSQIAIQRLEERFHFTNLTNLQGGIEAWLSL